MRRQYKLSLIVLFGLSLAVHVLTFLPIYWVEVLPPKPPSPFIEVMLNPPETAQVHQIVREVPIPEEVKQKEANDDPALFLSSQKQRVSRQTRVERFGPTRNQPRAPRPSLAELARQKEATALGEEPGNFFAGIPQPSEASLNNLLPKDVEIGSFTALNTDKFTYYSFFERVEDLIRFRWEQRVRAALANISREEIERYPRGLAISHIDVVLNLSGQIEKIVLLRSSGLDLIDRAPADAFWDAKQLPNPPRGLVEDDGYIHLRYQFLVLLKR